MDRYAVASWLSSYLLAENKKREPKYIKRKAEERARSHRYTERWGLDPSQMKKSEIQAQLVRMVGLDKYGQEVLTKLRDSPWSLTFDSKVTRRGQLLDVLQKALDKEAREEPSNVGTIFNSLTDFLTEVEQEAKAAGRQAVNAMGGGAAAKADE